MTLTVMSRRSELLESLKKYLWQDWVYLCEA